MLIYLSILVALIGLCIGSFLNVLIFRVDDLRSVAKGRSMCMSCKHTLAWYDLFPLFSWLFLRGKCRYCGKKISAQYPVVELLNAIVYLLIFQSSVASRQSLGVSGYLSTALVCATFSTLIIVAAYDLKTQYTPEFFVWIAVGFALLAALLSGQSYPQVLWGVLIGGGVPAFLVLVSREKWMGSGDIKIGLILGLLLGYPVAIFGMFTAFVIGAIVGIIYMKLKNKTVKDSLPFTPFLIFATFAALLWGQKAIDWYLGFAL